jgi:hypothetical protein
MRHLWSHHVLKDWDHENWWDPKGSNMLKKILLINEKGTQVWLEQKTNGSLWQNGEEIFSSEDEAKQKGWKVDAVKIIIE